MDRELHFLPAGEYYVGDLCYVFPDRWDEVCSLVIDKETSACKEGLFTLEDGTQFVMFNTKYGDGTYCDLDGNRYGVDAGNIGIVATKDIRLPRDFYKELGGIHEFGGEFYNFTDDGELHFGMIVINTDDEDADYDDGQPDEMQEWHDYDPDC